MNTWHDYVFNNYENDFRRFIAANNPGGKSRELFPSQFTFICDGNDVAFASRLKAAIVSSKPHFLTALTLEAVLVAGIHCNDHGNYQKYVTALPALPYVEAHGSGGVRRPHSLLGAERQWDAATLQILGDGCTYLLPAWSVAYDVLVGRKGKGRTVVESLATDPDLAINPYGILPDAVMATFLGGLRMAVQRIRLLDHPMGRA